MSGVFCRNHEHKTTIYAYVCGSEITVQQDGGSCSIIIIIVMCCCTIKRHRNWKRLDEYQQVGRSTRQKNRSTLYSNRQVGSKKKENENQQNDKSKCMWFMLEEVRFYTIVPKNRITAFLALNFVSFSFWKEMPPLHWHPSHWNVRCHSFAALCCFVYFVPRYACMCFRFFIRLK